MLNAGKGIQYGLVSKTATVSGHKVNDVVSSCGATVMLRPSFFVVFTNEVQQRSTGSFNTPGDFRKSSPLCNSASSRMKAMCSDDLMMDSGECMQIAIRDCAYE